MKRPWLQRRFLAVWLWLAALLLCGVLISRASFTADLSAFLPKAPTPEQRLLVDQLRDGVVSRLILVGIDGADVPTRAALSKAVARQLRTDNRFSTVSNGEAVAQDRDQAFLFEHRYQLSPAMTPEHFTVQGLRSAVSDTLDLLASPAGPAGQGYPATRPDRRISAAAGAVRGRCGRWREPAAVGGRCLGLARWPARPAIAANPGIGLGHRRPGAGHGGRARGLRRGAAGSRTPGLTLGRLCDAGHDRTWCVCSECP